MDGYQAHDCAEIRIGVRNRAAPRGRLVTVVFTEKKIMPVAAKSMS